MTTMAGQAYLYHVGAERGEPLNDVRDRETLENICVSLRMALYEESLAAKMKAWAAIAGSVTYARARSMNAAEFELFVGEHAHGRSRSEFWALVRCMETDPDKKAIFLAKANKGFQDYWEAHASTWATTWRGRC
jgi:hypothetical protein|mmetsp:Transcript_16737/g.37533  ORF Transcript_16737/g.37533 Transcript_16737/m.37533 type:complete len:134 (+) Transcript_16737:3555-3956(+)